jgi:sarcosine oxidase subunit beta
VDSFDVAIIGAGIAGSATAHRLASEGLDVIILEKSTVGFQASSRNAGGVRHMFRAPVEIPLARYSIDLWSGLSEELGHDVQYRQNGCIRLALNEAEVVSLREAFERDRKAGLPVELLGPGEIEEVIPVNPGKALLASYCPMDGHASPAETCRAFEIGMRRAGVTVREQVRVERAERGRTAFSIKGEGLDVEAGALLISAGPWSTELLSQFGINIPLALRRPEMAETTILEPFLKPFIGLGDLRGYGRQTVDGRMHMGIRNLDADLDAPESTHELIRNAQSLWSSLFPQLENAEIERSWSGFTARTPDECAIVSGVPEVPGLFVATGFSGHGFALGPGVGSVMADLIRGKKPAADISGLRIDRFLPAGWRPA